VIWAEVDLKLIGGTARFRIRLGGNNGADADIDLQEFLEGDVGRHRLFHARHSVPPIDVRGQRY
jgi:hypothetical protein